MTKPGPGKFEFNDSLEQSEILMEHSLDGSHDSLGDISTGFDWYCLITSDCLTELEKTVCPDPAYLCKENEQGFFFLYPFSSIDDAKKVFADLMIEWELWAES